MNDTVELKPGEDIEFIREKYLDLSEFTVPVLDFTIGKFGGIALMNHNERPGPIVAKLPPGRQIGKAHIDHIVAIWRQRNDLAPLNVFDTAHEIEVVEGTLHVNFIEDTNDIPAVIEYSELLDQVDTLIANQCGIDDHNMICPDWKLREDLGADSLDKVEIMWAIEKLQQGELPDATYDQWQTVQDIHNTVTRSQQWAENNGQPLDEGPDTEDGEWAYGWAYRAGKGVACSNCGGRGINPDFASASPHSWPLLKIKCFTCHGSGVIGFKIKSLQQEQ